MPGVLVGTARVGILPDMRGFLAETQADLKTALAALDTSVPVKFTIDKDSVAKAQAALGPLVAGKSVPLRFNVDPASAAKAKAALGPLAGQTVPIKFDTDKASLARAQAAARDALGLLPGGTIDLNFALNTGSLAKAAAQFRTATGLLTGGRLPLVVDFDYPSLQRAMAAFRAATGIAHGGSIPLDVNLNQTSLTQALAQFRAATGIAHGGQLPLNISLNQTSLARAQAAFRAGLHLLPGGTVPLGASLNKPSLVAAWAQLVAATHRPVTVPILPSLGAAGLARLAAIRAAISTNLAANAAGGAAGGGGRGVLGGAGGRFGWLTGTIGGVKLWHVALDGVAEAMLSVGLATVAAAAGITAMVNSTQDLYTHWMALTQVGDSFGTHLKPITGSFDNLNKAMAPQTIEAYGGALRAVESNTGAFNSTARQVVTVFDDWIAKIDLWVKAQGGFGSLLQSGVGYLQQFGHIVGTLGQALGNLLKEDPGIAHYLLDIVQGAAELLKLFTELPAPIVQTVLALHGLWLWSKVLSAPLLAAGRGLGYLSAKQVDAVKSGTSFKNLLKFAVTSPWGWIATASAAIGYFTYQASQGTPAARKFIDTINQRIDTDQASTAITDIGVAIGQLNTKIAATTSGSELKQMQSGGFWTQLGEFFTQGVPNWIMGVGHAFANLGHVMGSQGPGLGQIKAIGGIFTAIFGHAGAGAEAARIDISKYNAEIGQLLGKQKNLFTETGNLITQGHTYSQSLAIMNLAGVRAGDSVATMAIKVQNLKDGYKAAGIQAGLLGNSVNAVTFATLQQQSSIAKVTGGWDAFFKTVSGGETGFSQFAQQLATLNKDMSGSGSAAKATKVSLDGLNTSSIAARMQFQQTIGAAQTQADNLMTLASAAGDGTKGYHLLTDGIKGLVATLLPSVKGSKSATAELYALAQQGGYPAADSFKQLAEWAGKPATGLARTDKATTTLTVDAAGLARDVKRLSTALGTTLTNAMSTAIFIAHGGQASFNNFAEAMAHHSLASSQVAAATKRVGNTLIGTLHNVGEARQAFMTFAEGMGATNYQAKVLWDTFRNQPFSATGSKIQNVQQQIAQLAQKLGISKTAATALWDSMHQGQTQTSTLSKALEAYNTDVRNNTQNTDAGRGARAQLIKDLEKTGLTAGQAKIDVNNLTGAIKKIPPKEGFYLSMTGKGQYSIHQQGAYFQGESGHATQGGTTPVSGASGAYVHAGTTATADDVFARVSKGELIVPAKMVSAGLVDHLRGSIPGFADGGLVLAGNKNVLDGKYATNMVNNFTSDMTSSMVSAMKSAIKTAATAAASGFGIPGAVAATGPAQSIAKRLIATMGWADQWPALDLLWTRESGWRWNAANPSGAYGIPQSLPASKMAAAGADYLTNPETQIRWGLGYIKATYGGPDNAWAHELSHGWYDRGGILPPGLTLAANLTGKPEVVLPASQLHRAGHPGAGSNTYIAQFPDEWAATAMESRVRQAFTAMAINDGRRARIGRPN
jgi:hypothetical protein